MSARLEALARERQALLDRSALCRLRLRRDAFAVRGAMDWKRVSVAVVAVPALGAIAWSVALSLVGIGRAARMVALAGRVVLLAKLAHSALGYLRKPVATSQLLP